MPSMRRSQSSSPTLRSTPYHALGLVSSSSSGARAGGLTAVRPGPMRRAVSDSCTRRVLADIDWWTVTEGQRRDIDPASSDASNTDDGSVFQAIIDDNAETPPISEPVSLLLGPFAALSLAPHDASRPRHSLFASSTELAAAELLRELGSLHFGLFNSSHATQDGNYPPFEDTILSNDALTVFEMPASLNFALPISLQ